MARALSRHTRKSLSSRERELLALLVRGLSFAAAARELGLPLAEVERCHARLCSKLQLRDQPAVYEYAVAVGLLPRNGAKNGAP